MRELVDLDERAAVRALTRLARRDPSPEVRAAAAEGLRDLGAEDAIAETKEGPAEPEGSSATKQVPRSRPGRQDPGGIDHDSTSTESSVPLLSDPDLGAEDAIAETNEGSAGPEEPFDTDETPPGGQDPGDIDHDSISMESLEPLPSDPDRGTEDVIAETSQSPARPEEPIAIDGTPPSSPSPGGIDYDSMSAQSLVALLSDPDLAVREAAVDALGYNQHYGAIPDLWNAFFREPDWDAQDLILDSLEDMGQEVEEARELLYMTNEVEIDWDRLADSVQ